MNQPEQHERGKAFAVLPAAGMSRRMGCSKLLLPWRGDAGVPTTTILHRVLKTYLASSVDMVVLVARREDDSVIQIGRQLGVELVVPSEPPAEMKVSVQLALEHIGRCFQPQDSDTWLLSPADTPRVTSSLVNSVLRVRQETHAGVVVPTCRGKAGHPTAFAWSLAAEVPRLAEGEGIRELLKHHEVWRGIERRCHSRRHRYARRLCPFPWTASQ